MAHGTAAESASMTAAAEPSMAAARTSMTSAATPAVATTVLCPERYGQGESERRDGNQATHTAN
jgi:hypothetical protein